MFNEKHKGYYFNNYNRDDPNNLFNLLGPNRFNTPQYVKNSLLPNSNDNNYSNNINNTPFNAANQNKNNYHNHHYNQLVNSAIISKDSLHNYLLPTQIKNEKKYSIINNRVSSASKYANNNNNSENNNDNNVKNMYNQLNQVIENKKKKNDRYNNIEINENPAPKKYFNSSNNVSNIANNCNQTQVLFKKPVPRNPFKSTEIKSIKEVDLTNYNKPFANIPNIPHEYNPKAKSVKEYSYHEDQNETYRKEMQDFHKIIDKFLNKETYGYFSLFDGHGKGKEPIKYAKERLPEIFANYLKKTNFNIDKSFSLSLQKLDEELKKYPEIENCGSTVTIVFVYTEYNKIFNYCQRILYCANLGDSKCLLICNDKSYKVLTTEHKCNNTSEIERIKSKGGLVFNGRLFGQLVLSRALGDFSMKQNGLICEPSISKFTIKNNDKYIIIASDGVWDVISDKDMVNLCFDNQLFIKNNANFNIDTLGDLIVKTSISRGSNDNVSCIAISLN